jgi:hypothetical protein
MSKVQPMIKKTPFVRLCILSSAMLLLLSACGPTVNQIKPRQTVTVDQQFQKQLTPIPTIPAYRCGAWASNNAPDAYSTITIYARLTKDSTSGFAGITAKAIAHFKNGDMPLYDQPISDTNGYVMFNLFLAGRQPSMVPATINITFNTQDNPTTCAAFFTPK